MIMSFTMITQCPLGTFTNFLHWLMSTINKVIPDSDGRKVLIEMLSFENSNAEYKKCS